MRENYWKNRPKRILQMREYQRNRWKNDPEWREAQKVRLKKLYRKRIAWYEARNKALPRSYKQKARVKLNLAVKAGKITRPNNCDKCDKKCKPEGHHYKGYRFPFKVIWLCRPCHSFMHRK